MKKYEPSYKRTEKPKSWQTDERWNKDYFLTEEVSQGKLNLILEACFKLTQKKFEKQK